MITLARFCLLSLFVFFVAACSREPQQQAQGYIEGKYTYIASSVSGVLTDLYVSKGQVVKKGQKLFTLEQQPESDAYAAAEESLKQAIASRDAIAANLTYAKLTYDRYKTLVPKKAIQQSELDNAHSIYDSTIAQLAQANATIAKETAALAQAKWTLEQKTMSAPIDGFVFNTFYRLGEYTEGSKAILSLLAPQNIKAIFYISEKDLGAIQLNDKVEVRCNGCNQAYRGKISFISPEAEYTPPVIFSSDTNEKLIFRIEAVFEPDIAEKLHPGQPIIVTYFPHG